MYKGLQTKAANCSIACEVERIREHEYNIVMTLSDAAVIWTCIHQSFQSNIVQVCNWNRHQNYIITLAAEGNIHLTSSRNLIIIVVVFCWCSVPGSLYRIKMLNVNSVLWSVRLCHILSLPKVIYIGYNEKMWIMNECFEICLGGKNGEVWCSNIWLIKWKYTEPALNYQIKPTITSYLSNVYHKQR